MKQFVFFISLVFVFVFVGLSQWTSYKQKTWDDRIEVDISRYLYQESIGADRDDLDDALLEEYKTRFVIPEKLIISKQGDGYIWESNDNKKLTKITKWEGYKKYYVYSVDNGTEYIKIWVNLFEVSGCDARGKVWGTGNMSVYTPLDKGDFVIGTGYLNYHENIFQAILCPRMDAHELSIQAVLSNIIKSFQISLYFQDFLNLLKHIMEHFGRQAACIGVIA